MAMILAARESLIQHIFSDILLRPENFRPHRTCRSDELSSLIRPESPPLLELSEHPLGPVSRGRWLRPRRGTRSRSREARSLLSGPACPEWNTHQPSDKTRREEEHSERTSLNNGRVTTALPGVGVLLWRPSWTPPLLLLSHQSADLPPSGCLCLGRKGQPDVETIHL